MNNIKCIIKWKKKTKTEEKEKKKRVTKTNIVRKLQDAKLDATSG